MGVFDDKKFEELDWISQATEPIDSQMNEILGKLPEVIEIDFEFYKKAVNDKYGIELSLNGIVYTVIDMFAHTVPFSSSQLRALEKCFQLEVEGENLILDFEQKLITGGTIRLIKLISTMDEKVLESMLGSEGIDIISYSNFNGAGAIPRANEVMSIIGKCEDGLKTRSAYRKRSLLTKRLKTLFKNNEWKIKDTELANKVGRWINDYIQDGNLAAFSNFCRLKVMTHKDQPIYSMEEIS